MGNPADHQERGLAPEMFYSCAVFTAHCNTIELFALNILSFLLQCTPNWVFPLAFELAPATMVKNLHQDTVPNSC